jgi:predicted phage terminase large subunit-like protein
MARVQQNSRVIGLHPSQHKFCCSPKNVVGFIAGRGAGKTYSGSTKVLLDAKDGEPWMSISPDNGIITDTTLPCFIDIARKYGKLIRSVRSPYARVWFKTQDGGKADIIFRSAEAPEKIRGPSKAGLWMDEASIMTKAVFDIAIATLRHRGAKNQVILTMTPRGKFHWTFELFFRPIDEYESLQFDHKEILHFGGQMYVKRDNTELIHAASYANPFLPEGYSERLREQYSKEFAEQEIEGNFVDLAGLMFKRVDFQYLNVADIPRGGQRIRYWDQASTPGGGDYSVGTLMLRDAMGRFIIESVIRGQWSPAERRDIMLKTANMDANKYGNEVVIYVEQEAGSGGKEQMDQNVNLLAGFPVYRDRVAGSGQKKSQGVMLPNQAKIVRAMPYAAQVENGNVYLVRSKWNEPFISEHVGFPYSTFDDQVDTGSGCINKLSERISSNVSPEMLKSDILQSHAARILQLANDLSLNPRGSEPVSNIPERLSRGLQDSDRGGLEK